MSNDWVLEAELDKHREERQQAASEYAAELVVKGKYSRDAAIQKAIDYFHEVAVSDDFNSPEVPDCVDGNITPAVTAVALQLRDSIVFSD